MPGRLRHGTDGTEEVLGVTVDIGTPESLRADIRDEVFAETVRL